MKVKEESGKVGLKLNIQKMKIMAFCPINSWQIHGKTMQTVTDFIIWGSKIPADGDCSHEIKRRLLLGRKVMTNLDSVLKSRDITLPADNCLLKAMVVPVVICGCESWTIKKAEDRRIDAFDLWCWRRLLRAPFQPVYSKGNQSWIFIGRTDAEAEIQYFGHLMRKIDSFENTLMLGKIEGRRWRGWQDEMVGWLHWLNGHEFE